MTIRLREVSEEDVAVFFTHQSDPVSYQMAGFTASAPGNRLSFEEYWRRRRADPGTFVRTIDVDGEVVGYVMSTARSEVRSVAYWIAREQWGRGIATAALRQFLEIVTLRPLIARAVADNVGSLRVLEKCGFVAIGRDQGFANGRGEVVDEVILRLE